MVKCTNCWYVLMFNRGECDPVCGYNADAPHYVDPDEECECANFVEVE